MYQHPQYVGLYVYEGQKGDSPKPGAFFKPKHGLPMLKVLSAAYGSTYGKLTYARKVNGNSWNVEQGRAGIVVYRNSDSNCNAAKISPDQAPGAANVVFGSGPWIAQCPTADPQQIFWIPPKDQWAKRPEDLSASKPFDPPKMSFTPPEKTPQPDLPGVVFVPPGTSDEDSYIPSPTVEDKNRKWWIIGGIAAAVAAAGLGYYAWRKRKK